jgi:hypothetical protein
MQIHMHAEFKPRVFFFWFYARHSFCFLGIWMYNVLRLLIDLEASRRAIKLLPKQ